MGGRNFQFSHSVSVLRVPSGEKGHPLVEVKTSGNIGSLCAAVGFTVAEDNKVVRQARESISLRYANMQATLPPLKPLFLAFVFQARNHSSTTHAEAIISGVTSRPSPIPPVR